MAGLLFPHSDTIPKSVGDNVCVGEGLAQPGSSHLNNRRFHLTLLCDSFYIAGHLPHLPSLEIALSSAGWQRTPHSLNKTINTIP